MKHSELILIIAREKGSKEISRQNLRIISEKPLLYYVIRNAIKYRKAFVVVSTDSDEIKHLSALYGAEVVLRPKKLTKDSVTLEEIAEHSIRELKKQGQEFEKCLLLHPHFPLISEKTIKKFFNNLNSNKKTIFGIKKNINFNEKFGQILNDNDFRLEILNKKIAEVKKIVSFNCKNFLSTKKFSKPYHSIEIPNEEIFSPNSYHDFASLESMINKKRILVRVDGAKTIGLGHVYNMLTILNYFRNEEILILMDNNKKMGIEKFKEYLYNVKTFSDQKQLFNIIREFDPQIIFNDILNTKISYMKKLKKTNSVIVNFEDLGQGRKFANYVINPIYSAKKIAKNEYYGYKFSCVRDEFRLWQKNFIRKDVEQIAISFGGTDPKNKTVQVLKIIRHIVPKTVKIKVILGFGNKHKKTITNIVRKMNNDGFNLEIIEKSDFLAKHFIESDFAIVSNGRTTFEVAAAKVPIIAISVNEREKMHSFVNEVNVGFSIKLDSKLDEKQLERTIIKMMKFSNRKKLDSNLKKINLFRGVDRINELIKKSNF